MNSTISAKLYFAAVVAILLTGQMSYCDNAANVAINNTAKLNGSSLAQSNVAETAKKSVEPVKAVIEEQVPQPIKNAAAPALAAPAAPAADAVPAAVAVPAVAAASDSANVHIIAEKYAIPGSIQTGFYIFVAFGLIVICFMTYRSYRLRSSRAARRYGTRGNHSRHELQPLPSAIELESEDEENTVFDRINNKN